MNRVQFGHTEAAGAGTTIAATVNGIAAGCLMTHHVCLEAGTGTVTSVRDDLSADAVSVLALSAAGLENLELWYHKNYGGGSRTFTATFDVSHNFRGLVCTEYAGVDPVSPLEGTASATGTGTTPSSGNVSPAPTTNGSLIVGHCCGQNQPSAGAPFIEVFQDTVNFVETEDYIQPTAAAVAATFAQASGTWGALAAVFLPAVVDEQTIPRANRSSVPPNVRIAGTL